MADFGFANKSNSSDFSSTGDKSNEVFSDLLLNRTELEAMITSLKRRQYGATPPANPNTGDVWECSTTGGGYTATVVYRYNGSAWLELVASAINVANRNTVLQGKVDASGNPDLFQAGTGLAVKLNATATPAIFAFMNGNSTSLGTVDIVAAVSADAATFWSSLPTSSTVYLYVDYTAGTVSGGFTTLAPVYQSIAPTHSAGLHWFDYNTGKTWSSDGSTWTQRNRVCVGTATTDGSGVTAVDVYAYNQTQGVSIFDDIITKGPWVDVRAFGAVGDGVTDDSAAIQAAIDYIKTSEYTENIPTQRVTKKVYLPGGIYKVSSTITIPSYVHFCGDGRHVTFLDSYITDGSPVLLLNNGSNVQFYTTLEGFTISGRSQDCIGIQMIKNLRWIMRDILVNLTNGEGVYLDESYLGEAYSIFLRGCGDATHNSMLITGPSAPYGGNSVSFFGGELAGGPLNGAYCKYGSGIKFFGTAFEGFTGGAGLINESCYALNVNGCYFEQNQEHILETGTTLSSNYNGNFFAFLQAGGRGHIGITYAQGANIVGNYFEGAATKIFDATADSTGRLYTSSVKNNLTQTFPLSVSASLLVSAKTSGTIIETFDSSFYVDIYGYHKYKDVVVTEGALRARGQISQIGSASGPGIYGGAGTPEGVIAAPIGSLYLCQDGSKETLLYRKNTGVGNTGWIRDLAGSVTWDPASLADGVGETSAAITVTGAALGDYVMIAAPYDLQGITCNGYVSAENTVKIRLQNETGGPIDLASGTWKVRVIK